MTVRVAVVYYSATGDVHHLAEAIAGGATTAGAEVRPRRGAQLARRSTPTPPGATMAPPLPPLSLKQPLAPWHGRTRMPWAPARFGDVAAQLKQFVDQPAVLALTGSSALRRRFARRGQHRRLREGQLPVDLHRRSSASPAGAAHTGMAPTVLPCRTVPYPRSVLCSGDEVAHRVVTTKAAMAIGAAVGECRLPSGSVVRRRVVVCDNAVTSRPRHACSGH